MHRGFFAKVPAYWHPPLYKALKPDHLALPALRVEAAAVIRAHWFAFTASVHVLQACLDPLVKELARQRTAAVGLEAYGVV